MKKLLLLFAFSLLMVSCNGQTKEEKSLSSGGQKSSKKSNSNTDSSLKIESAEIEKKLSYKIINTLVPFDSDTFSIPFNYSMKANNKRELIFLWQLGDLEISSEADNYFSFSFDDQIRFRDDEFSGGYYHIVWTNDKGAVTDQKVRKQLIEADAKILYAANNGYIYEQRGIINTIYYEYLEDKKAFGVYLSFNDFLKFSRFDDITLEQKLDLAIAQLRFAKQFYHEKKLNTPKPGQIMNTA